VRGAPLPGPGGAGGKADRRPRSRLKYRLAEGCIPRALGGSISVAVNPRVNRASRVSTVKEHGRYLEQRPVKQTDPCKPNVQMQVAARCPNWTAVSVYGCQAGHSTGVPVPCKRTGCRTCQPLVSARRGARLGASIGGVPLGAVVLTLPGLDLGAVTWPLVRVLRKVAFKVVAYWARKALGTGKIGGYCAVHPAGDTCRKCGEEGETAAAVNGACTSCGEPAVWRPHFHVGFPLVNERGKRVNPHVHKPALALLRRLWGSVVETLGKQFGLSTGLPVVHYAYKKPGSAVAHRLRYDLRSWPAWVSANAAAKAALRVTRYGLAAGASSASEAWRKAVAGEQLAEGGEPPTLPCAVCGDCARYKHTIPFVELERSVQMVYQWEG
jgi:hypothetical protein